MSTRAFLTIIDEEKNIQMSAFYSNSAYPGYLGLKVLDAIQNCAFPQFIDQIREEDPEELETVVGIRRDWYIRGKDNKDDYFHDYAYELNGATQELTVYHFGDKALTIPYEQIPLYRFIFEHEGSLYNPLCLDERSMTLKKDFYKELRTMIKNGAGVDELQAVIDKNPSVLYLESGRIKDHWDLNSDSFNKRVCTSDGRNLMFHVNDFYGNFHIYVQTPFIRAPIPHSPIKSAKGAEKFLADLVRDRPDDIRATIDLFKELKDFSEQVRDIYSKDDEPLDDRADKTQALKLDMLSKLMTVKKEHNIMGGDFDLLERETKDVCARLYRCAKERMDDLEKKSSFADTLKDAVRRAEGGSNSGPEPVISAPER